MTQKMRGSLSRPLKPGIYTNKSTKANVVEPKECKLGCGNTTRAKNKICVVCDILGIARHRKLRREYPDLTK